jgi:hypothetical protein
MQTRRARVQRETALSPKQWQRILYWIIGNKIVNVSTEMRSCFISFNIVGGEICFGHFTRAPWRLGMCTLYREAKNCHVWVN